MFQLKHKVALITGGASGIGLKYAQELLKHGVKGVAIVDVNKECGMEAVKSLTKEYGTNKVIFVKTDVTNRDEFEDAFKKTVETFKNIDIVINNAGIMNDSIWEKEISINFNGTVNGTSLAIEHYLQKFRSGDEGVVVNTASIAALQDVAIMPVYAGTKAAVVAFTKSYGSPAHYKISKVKTLVVCPGITETSLMQELADKSVRPEDFEVLAEETRSLGFPRQTPDHVAKEIIGVIENGKTGTVWVIEGGEHAYEMIMADRRNVNKK